MKRKVIDGLIEWYHKPADKPVLLTGAKGVGKTYVAYDFAKSFFEQILYINFEREPGVRALFQAVDPIEVLRRITDHFKLTDSNEENGRILILDEITFCPEALKQLKFLHSNTTFPRLIVITSIPLSMEDCSGFHVFPVHPLEFDEFLLATANDWYIEPIMTHFESNQPLPEIVHNELLALHELYMKIGGMPGTVNEYMNLGSLVNIAEQHSRLTGVYHDYILQSSQESEALKMNQVLDSLPQQLMKPNKKFQYKLIRRGTTHAMYKDAIRRLKECNYLLQCHKYITEQNDTSDNIISEAMADVEGTNFKLYLPDVGFLSSRLAQAQYESLDSSVRKALLENYVAEAFHAKGYPLVFWDSESMAKIEFILSHNGNILPIEIHTDENTRSKSISVLKQKYDFPYAVKISPKNFEFTNQVKYVPYYAVFCL